MGQKPVSFEGAIKHLIVLLLEKGVLSLKDVEDIFSEGGRSCRLHDVKVGEVAAKLAKAYE